MSSIVDHDVVELPLEMAKGLLADAERYRKLRMSTAARIALAVDVFEYEKMGVPTGEWLDAQIDARLDFE